MQAKSKSCCFQCLFDQGCEEHVAVDPKAEQIIAYQVPDEMTCPVRMGIETETTLSALVFQLEVPK